VFNQFGGSVTLTNATANNAEPDYVGVANGVFTGKLAIGGGIDQGGNDGGNGIYNLFGGSIDTTGNGIEVGPSGTGVMNQFGGTVNTTFLTMGFSGNGTYNLSGDNSSTVTAFAETVGYAGTGTFNQSGGVNTIGLNSDGSLQNPGATALEVGLQCCGNSPGTGTYFMTGGILNTGNMVVGDGEQGTFIQSPPIATDPAVNVTGNLTVGGAANGTGSYSITGDQSTLNVLLAPGGNGVDGMGNPNPNGALIVGDAGTGTFVQGGDPSETTGPAVNVAGDLVLGHQFGSQGTYTLNNGALTVDGNLVVGSASTENNQFIQTGGSVTLTNNAGGSPDYTPVTAPNFGTALYVGGENVGDNGTGTYTMTGGTLSASTVAIGFSGTGTFNQSGGAVSASFVDLGDCGGCNGGNSAGFYNINGTGQLTTNALNVADFGHGEFTQGADLAGNTLVTVNGTLAIGNGATATPNTANSGSYDRSGTYTLDSGALNTQYTIVGNAGTGAFIQNGGTHAITNALTIGAQNSQPLSGPAGSGTDSNPVFGGPAPGTYTMTGGSLTANGDQSTGNDTSGAGIIVGDAGNGTFNQTGGSVTSGVADVQRGDLLIGAQAGSTGNYNLGDSTNGTPTSQVYGDTIIGRDAAGSVTVSVPNPDSTPDNPLPNINVVVPLAPANGTLTIAGDGTSMSVNQYAGFDSHNGGNLIVGLNGTGAVTQTDQSTVYLDHSLVLGANAMGNGSYTLSATSITDGSNSGDNLFVGSDLNIGGQQTDVYGYTAQTTATGGNGTFTQTSGDVFVVGSVNIGNNGGTGTYSQSGGTVTTGGLVVGNGGAGEYDLSGGTLAASQAVVGAFGGSVGTFNQTGGTFNANFLNVGIFPGGVGTYTMSAGNLNVAGNLGLAGPNGQGTFNQSGGTVQAGGLFDNNDNEGTPGGSYSISGGSLSVSGVSYIGNGADDGVAAAGQGGLFTQTGGQVTFSDALNIGIGANSSGVGEIGSVCPANPSPCVATGAYTMSGGTASINTLNVGGGSAGSTGTFTMNANPGDSPAPNPSLDPVANITSLTIATGGNVQINGGLMTVGATSTGGQGGQLNVGSAGTASITGGSLGTVGDFNVGIGGGSALFTQTGGTVTVGTDLIVGSAPGDTGTYNMTGGSTTVSGFTFVGLGGAGTFLNDAASHTTQELVLGTENASNGTYTLQNGAQLTVGSAGNTGFADIGEHGTGTFTQNDSTSSSTIHGSLDVGREAGGSGTVNLNAGNMTVAQGFAVIGDSGTGIFNQSGFSTMSVSSGGLAIGRGESNENGNTVITGTGTYNLSGSASLTVTGGIEIAQSAGNTGTMSQTGGSVIADKETIGDGGIGAWNQSAGTNAVSGNVNVGFSSGGTGTYTLGGSGATTIGGNLDIGVAANSSGTFNFNTAADDAASLALTTSGSTFTVGAAGNGTFNQGGGDLAAAGVTLDIGAQHGSIGTYNMTGGSLEDGLIVGDAGTGTFNNTGGSHSVSGDLVLGSQATGNGTYKLSGMGALTVSGDAVVGDAGAGTYTQTGGTASVTGAMTLGNSITGTGSAEVSGGTLSLGSLVVDAANTSAATSSFTVDGGAVSVTGGVTVNASGTPNGSSLSVSSGSLSATTVTNNDTLKVTGGTVTAAVTNNHQFNFQGGKVAGSVTNNGTTNTSGGGTATVTGTYTNTSTGTTTVTGNSTLKAGGSVSNAGTVTVASGSTLDATGNTYTQTGGTTTMDGLIKATVAEINAGTFEGTGTVSGDLSNVGGTVRPGDAPGTMTVTGNYSQGADGTFEAGIDGTNASQISKLVVDGTASLSGTLDVDLLDGFQVANGDIFNIMSFASSTGDFTNFELNGNACTAGGADIYNCSGLGDGLFFEEEFVNNDTGLDLLVEQTVVTPPSDVPEPWTVELFGVGLAGLAAMRRRLKTKKN
jgi:fibronectin-binding autotransporter adhesin